MCILYVNIVSWFIGLTTVGWGAMEYGNFDIEKKLGWMERVVIDKKYRKQITTHDYSKLYWFDYPCAKNKDLLVFWKVGKHNARADVYIEDYGPIKKGDPIPILKQPQMKVSDLQVKKLFLRVHYQQQN